MGLEVNLELQPLIERASSYQNYKIHFWQCHEIEIKTEVKEK